MQTFLPSADFHEAMRALDAVRLGNQVYREGLTLLRGGWPRHPAARMWRGYRRAFAEYLLAGLDVLAERGRPAEHHRVEVEQHWSRGHPGQPNWLGDPALHASHRSNLLRKNPRWFSQFGWAEQSNLPYIWPRSDRAHMTELY